MQVLLTTTVVLAACSAPSALHWTQPSAASANGELRWSGRSDATSFSILLREQIPNGRRLADLQRTVEESRLPYVPAAASGLTKVSAQVTAHCASGLRSEPAVLSFTVDRRNRCPPPGDLSAVANPAGLRLSWSRSAVVARYEVRAFRLDNAQPLAASEAFGGAASLTLEQPAVVHVIAWCGPVASAPAQLFWVPPQ